MAANIWQDIKMRFHQGNMIMRLIIINVAIHLSLALIGVAVFLVTAEQQSFWSFVSNWFYFPSELVELPLRFWTIFTYMFLHWDLMHIFFNMWILYAFGQKLGDLLSDRHVLPIYIWGGFMGALFFMIGFNVIPAFHNATGNLVGASASVMAVVLATATLNPRGTFYLIFIGPVQLQYIAAIWVIINIIAVPGGNPGGALAHLGGAFMGWWYIRQLGNGNDWSKPIHAVLDRFSRQEKTNLQQRPKQRRAKTSTGGQKRPFRAKMQVHKGSAASDYFGEVYSRSFVQKYKSMSREECLDSILDKIKRSGYDSLTKDEKIFLDRYRDR